MIRNVAWRNNPTQFQYKLAEEGQIQIAGLESVKEFGILGESKYVKFVGDIDRSSESLSDMSSDFEPSFQKEELFLKVVIEGKASLYEYRDGNLTRYFFGMQNSEISQLVYKSYLTSENRALKNKQYKKQLQEKLTCEGISLNAISELEYDKKELEPLFINYNTCTNSDFKKFGNKSQRGVYSLAFKPALQSATLLIDNRQSNSGDADFGSKLGVSLGFGLEYVFPFNKNTWSAFIEPAYQSFKMEKELATQSVDVSYNSIELPVGVRHYFFLNDKSKIFVNGAYVLNFSGSSKINFESDADLDIKTNGNFMLGLGYSYNGKYNLEFRHGLKREILGGYSFWHSEYKTTSIVFGYKIF
ncbi:tRNA modification GTPase [Roseivirga seohaensis]|uniref:tRNA modification GTPase n=1 Tax=Roseivirga seohaensis TaxID=1914963 RepID=UPI003BAAAB42